MTYAALVATLETLALEAGAGSFWTGTKAAAGINYNAAFPQAELFFSPSALIGETAVRYEIGMLFCGNDTHEGGTADTVRIQSEIDELTQRFAMLVRDYEGWELVSRAPAGDFNRLPTVRTGTQVGTGFYIDFTVNVLAIPC